MAQEPTPMPVVAYCARALALLIMLGVLVWVMGHLGGLALAPTAASGQGGGNDTGKLFNWHPLLMTLAFCVFMAEALLTYVAPLVPMISRDNKKRVHYTLHACAAVCALGGLTAAYKSHSLKLPVPIPHFYSPHSILGLGVLLLFFAQAAVGFGSYVYPKIALPQRVALGPWHRFVGMAAWCMGLAAIATGLQEKVTFLQMGKGLSGDALFGAVVRLPAVLQLALALLAVLVLYHQCRSLWLHSRHSGKGRETDSWA